RTSNRSVTPEVAGSSPVAPVLSIALLMRDRALVVGPAGLARRQVAPLSHRGEPGSSRSCRARRGVRAATTPDELSLDTTRGGARWLAVGGRTAAPGDPQSPGVFPARVALKGGCRAALESARSAVPTARGRGSRAEVHVSGGHGRAGGLPRSLRRGCGVA